jgi:streptogramin lyase
MVMMKLIGTGLIFTVGILILGTGGVSTSEPAYAIPVDDNTVTLTYWSVPLFQNHISNMASDFGENIYFAYANMNKIGRLDPESNIVTEWTLNSNSSISHISIDLRSGFIYFTYEGMNKIGRLHPETNVVTEWTLKGSDARLNSLTFDSSSGEVYFTSEDTNWIGRLNPETNLATEWTLPGNSSDRALTTFTAIDPSSSNFYVLKGTSSPNIVRLDPSTNNITEWTIPKNSANVTSFSRGFDGYYFTYEDTNNIGKFDPTTNNVTEWTIQSNTTGLSYAGFDLATGMVYFAHSGGNQIGRWVPYNGVTTEWKVVNSPVLLTIAPSGSVYFADELGRIGRIS